MSTLHEFLASLMSPVAHMTLQAHAIVFEASSRTPVAGSRNFALPAPAQDTAGVGV